MAIKGGCVFLPRYNRGGETRIGQTYMIQYRTNGSVVRESAKTQDRGEAERVLLKRMAEAQEGRGVVPSKASLENFMHHRLVALKPSVDQSTFERYQYCADAINRAGSPLRRVSLVKVDAAKVSEYVSWRLANGAGKPTVAKEVGFLKSILTEARLQRRISVDTLLDVRDSITPRRCAGLRGATKPRDRYLAPHEIDLILQTIPKDNPNLRDAFALALYTGLRQENILGLTEGQISLASDPPVIRFGADEMKSGRTYAVQVGPRAAEILWRRSTMDPTRGDRRLFSDFRPSWKRLQARLRGRLDAFRWHDLRRTYATYRIAAGVDPKSVQYELAHMDPRLTLRVYAQPIPPDVRAWAREHFAWGLEVRTAVRTPAEVS